jgi:hypothetical protein
MRMLKAILLASSIVVTIGCGGAAKDESSAPDEDLGVGQVYPPRPRLPGAINLNAVFAVLARERDAMQACFDRDVVRKNLAIDYTVKARFTVELDGSPSDVSTYGKNPKFATCVATVIQGLTFPTPTGGPASAYGEVAPVIRTSFEADDQRSDSRSQ